MKRKLFNAALFGAVLVAAPVSTFVSCADYDSDITALDQEIGKLNDLVDQKEAAINKSLAELKAQDEALKAKDEALDKAIADCKANCATELANGLAKCKADCAAARAELEAAIKALITAAETKHGEDVQSLLEADKELQKGIDAAKAYAEGVQANLDKLQGEVGKLEEKLTSQVEDLDKALQDLKVEVGTVKDNVKKVADDLDALKKYVDEKVDELNTLINKTKTDLEGQIASNTTLINGLSDALDAHKKAYDEYKGKVDAELKRLADVDNDINERISGLVTRVGNLENRVTTVEGDVQTLKTDLEKAQGDITALQGAVATLQGEVAKNAKSILDLLTRMIDAEVAIFEANQRIDEAVKNLGLLQADYEAFKVAQAAIDQAQDAALAAAVAELKNADNELKTQINEKYTAALQYAAQAAAVAQANAETYAKTYADDNFYNKAKVDEIVAAVVEAYEAADAKRDEDFRAWIELELNPAFAAVWGELYDENGASRLSLIEEGLALTQQDVFNLTEGLRQVTLQADANATKIAEVEEAYKAADAQRDADFRAWIEQDLNPAFYDVWEAINALSTSVSDLSKEVKGFVLEPASYYEGIQAIEGTSYEYHTWNVTDAVNPVQDGELTKYCPSVVAHYHVNPTKAVLSTDVANYSFAVLDRTNRGVNTKLQPVITKVAQDVREGILDVTLRLTDPEANKTPQGHQDPSEVTVMALQYKNPAALQENQVVTSDYAVLYLNPLKEVSLVGSTDTNHEISDIHEFADLGYVEYTQSYDIQAEIKTKFGGEEAVSITDQNWPEGFTYRYTWVSGDHDYFTEITADGQVTPQLPNGQPATTACVGKNATWRIDVMHGDDVVEVGFYKVIITGEAVVETAPAEVVTDKYAVACAPYTAPALQTTISLDNVWNQIVNTTGEDVETVKTKYAISLTTDGMSQRFVQFTKYLGEGDRELYKQYAGIGVVELTTGGEVVWTVDYDDPALEELFTLTKERKAVTTYVRVRSLDAISKDTYNEFYLPLTWAPEPIELWGEYQPLSWTYDRVANQWQSNKVTREEHELRLYADLTNDLTYPDFKYDIRNKAMKGEFKVEFTGDAKNFENVLSGDIQPVNGHFRFIEHPVEDARFYDVVLGYEEDGTPIEDTYELTVSEDGSELLAGRAKSTPVVIATISAEGVVILQNNATTQLLLNAYEKDELGYGQTLCARVGYAYDCCAGAVKVENGDFDVRFIKPLTIEAHDINISDADDTTNSGIIMVSVLDQIKCFNGYSLAERPQYKSLFGVYVEMGTPDEWYTNYDAAETDFTKQVKDHASIKGLFYADEDKGEITYENNTSVVSDFTVLVPLKVKYVWNATPVETVIKLNVHRTKDNSNRR